MLYRNRNRILNKVWGRSKRSKRFYQCSRRLQYLSHLSDISVINAAKGSIFFITVIDAAGSGDFSRFFHNILYIITWR